MLAAAAFTVAVPAGAFGWLWLVERVAARRSQRWRTAVRAAGWLGPAGILLAVFLAWPMLATAVLSFRDASGQAWAGLHNYQFLVSDGDVRVALRNNVAWLIVLAIVPVVIGLAVATLADRVRHERVAKAVVVAPIAISFVAGAIIWQAMFEYQPSNRPQVSTLNAVLAAAPGVDPVAWLIDTRTNNAALITVGVWMTVGFATIVLSAALKGLPAELVEASKMDGATSWQTFRYITLPQLRPALVVVATAMAITALKAFDVVYVMTNGAFDTNVIANVLYQQLFVSRDDGRASAVAVLLAAAAAPIIYLNVRRGRLGDRAT